MQSVSSCEGNVTTHGVEDGSRVETRQRAISSPDCSPRQAPAGQTGAGKYVRLKRVGRVAQVVEQRPFKAFSPLSKHSRHNSPRYASIRQTYEIVGDGRAYSQSSIRHNSPRYALK